MGTDWFVRVKCPKPKKKAKSKSEHIELCSGCPYAVWGEPESGAGFMSSMCGVRVGSIWMARELDEIGKELTGVEWFTKEDDDPAAKKEILERIRAHVRDNGWTIQGLSEEETLEHLNSLLDFCHRADSKGLEISVWA